jgi:hypothetical protein
MGKQGAVHGGLGLLDQLAQAGTEPAGRFAEPGVCLDGQVAG